MHPAFIICATVADEFLGINRLVGIVRRRGLDIDSIAIGAGRETGMARVTIVLRAEPAAVDRLVLQLRKMIGVTQATASPDGGVAARELALIRVRATGARYAEVLDTATRFGATVLEETHDEVLLEATGPAPLLISLIRALEPYGVLDVARSGVVALERPPSGESSGEPSPTRAITAHHAVLS
jgi:acetolactate synthase I/III small subunit